MSFLQRAPLSLHHIIILLCFCYMVIDHVVSQPIGSLNLSCIDSERWALLKFKSGLVFDSDSKRHLSDWSHGNMDCCRWEGIRCSKAGRVVTIDLHRPYDDNLGHITGEISPFLLHLPYLNYLDLSNNDFTKVPEFVGSLKRLRYLNLSYNALTGKVPHHLGNLSALETLDLKSAYLSLHMDSLAWVGRLTSLKYLDMSYVYLHSTKDWLQSILKLPSLTSLYLGYCKLPFPAPIEINVSTSLEVVDLTGSRNLNLISLSPWLNASTKLVDLTISTDGSKGTPFPDYLTKLVSIRYLDLSNSQLEGSLPETFSNLSNLIRLKLSNNYLEGALPEAFSNLSNLISVDLSVNGLNSSYGFLQSGSNSLEELGLNDNELQGTLPNLSKFPSLQLLNLAKNEFKQGLAQLLRQSSNLSMLDVSSNHFDETLTGIPFSKFSTLQVLNFAQNNISGSLAQFLQQSSNLIELDVSSNQFFGTLTEAHFQNLTNLLVLRLSLNSLTLNFSTGLTLPFQLQILKLRGCKLGKLFPHWLRTQKKLISLDISCSGISDTIPSWFWAISSQLKYLNVSHNAISGSLPPGSLSSCDFVDLSSNRFYGGLPSFSKTLLFLDVSSNAFSGGISFLCSLQDGDLFYIDLSNNTLSGTVPRCSEPFLYSACYLNLDNNNFTGSLSNSVGGFCNLLSLRLRNNSFSGNVPQSLEDCSDLHLLDLGENQFSGTIPDWIGTSATDLIVLRLNSNKFEGIIPSTLCRLNSIAILDLSDNNISGTIPSCLNNFTAMGNSYIPFAYGVSTGSEEGLSETEISNLDDFTAWVFWKGLEVEFKNAKTIELLSYMDLSSNRLSGMIPEELTSLKLVVLNLSHNVLIGSIPDKIGEMRMLESLDLSHNLLSSEIPSSMADLYTLNYLDLSYNNLTGSIPVSTQISTFNATMFRGNIGLCGAPLPNSCHLGENVNDHLPNSEGGDDNENLGIYISIVLGFIVGFWGVCGPLVINNSWRQKYFQTLIHIKERFLVTILIGLAYLRRKFAS